MSEHCSKPTSHTKTRGKIRGCDWCGQKIQIGEPYEKWLFFCDGDRITVYAHKECSEAWGELAKEEGGIAYGGDGPRPERKATT